MASFYNEIFLPERKLWSCVACGAYRDVQVFSPRLITNNLQSILWCNSHAISSTAVLDFIRTEMLALPSKSPRDQNDSDLIDGKTTPLHGTMSPFIVIILYYSILIIAMFFWLFPLWSGRRYRVQLYSLQRCKNDMSRQLQLHYKDLILR